MSIKIVNPTSLYDGTHFGMSHVTIDTDNGLVFVSGQVDWDTNYQVKHDNIEAQAESAMQNLVTALEAASSSMANILHLRIYIRGEIGEHGEKVVPIIAQYIGQHRPATTAIGVASLASPDTLIEIEAIAKVTK